THSVAGYHYRVQSIRSRVMGSRLGFPGAHASAHAPADGLTSRMWLPEWSGFLASLVTRPLLAAFATIAVLNKCFNSIKIVMMPLHEYDSLSDHRRANAGGRAGIGRPAHRQFPANAIERRPQDADLPHFAQG